MERAGRAMAEHIISVAKEKNFCKILVVCGGGNNGGDGFVIARVLSESGYHARVLCLAEKFSADCTAMKEKFTGEILNKIPAEKFDVIVDCIFGTGLSREVGGKELDLIRYINTGEGYVFSADIPSGLNGDNGLVMGECVQADETITVQAAKNGLFLNDGADKSGKITVVDIGITLPSPKEYALISEEADIARIFPRRKRNSHKGTYGKVSILAGSVAYSGAPLLSAYAALRTGAGYTELCVPEKLFSAFMGRYPEAILTCMKGENSLEYDEEKLFKLLKSDCIALGMGCGISSELYKIIGYLLEHYTGILLLDADGLNTISKYGVGVLKGKKCDVLITPHIKEFSRLSGLSVGEITKDPIEKAKAFAEEYAVTVLLKSSVSVVTDGKSVYLNTRGCAALAKGGSGDVLSGIISSLCAQGNSAINGAMAGSYLLGSAAELCAKEKGEYSVLARDVIEKIPNVILGVTEQANDQGGKQ
jgi:NAD(P)H-hydrate epimerase